MSIQDGSVNDLILMDKNYLHRIQLRKEIMKNHPEHVIAAEAVAKSAVNEFYTWLLGIYLPTRYPRMFQSKSIKGRVLYLHNISTNENLPLIPPENPLDSLQILGGLVDEDFLFLLPSDDGDGYTLKAFVTCFPNGFDTLKKLNLKLRDIHKPVPHYKEKLEKSMDRYFDKMKVGKFMRRANWAIQPNEQLFKVAGNHLYEGDNIPEEEFDINRMRLRVERQYLHRLPQSRALLFSFKTLLYTLPEIKNEGLAEDLVEAINGLRQGNAPGFHFYKRAAVWGEFVKAYLRS
ncbi:hypothetical protein N7478_002811 [Penicillium angulare]|uniref:uncharacterized protein n=1 Tax=Penicillium angulare TaxID=116970 RepID=UPI00253F9B36|nr:uncharacterized protein N7478_002811 [Penicillium angulare]KAJ5287125.1 hypothetical protein N7478_002811 [Penicillium angulare]